jgi:hypothetical protein
LDVSASQGFQHQQGIRVVRVDGHSQADINVTNVPSLDAKKIPLQARRLVNAAELLITFQAALGFRPSLKAPGGASSQEQGICILRPLDLITVQVARCGCQVILSQRNLD